jgi:hypothetical protein
MNEIDKNQNDITNEIDKKFVKDECGNIGNLWKRTCFKCGKEQFYKDKYGLFNAIKKNTKCRCCVNKEIIHKKTNDTIILYKKICPLCKREIIYKGTGAKYNLKESIKNNYKCISCCRLGHKISDVGRKRLKNLNMGKIHTEETKYKLRISTINDLKNKKILLGKCGARNFNPKACEYIDKLNEEKKWNLQHALNGGEVELYGYFVDGYDKEKNIVFEYDEPHHYVRENLKEKDFDRMNDIINYTTCSFYRYNEKTKKLSTSKDMYRKEVI